MPERRPGPVRGDLPARRRAGRLRARRLGVRRAPHRDCAARQRAGDRRRQASRPAIARDAPAVGRDDQESRMKRRRLVGPAIGVVVVALGAAIVFAVPRLPERGNDRADGGRRQGPAQAHGPRHRRAARRPHHDARDAAGRRHAPHRQMQTTGMPVKNGEVVMEFDPADQQYRARAGEVRAGGSRAGNRQDEGRRRRADGAGRRRDADGALRRPPRRARRERQRAHSARSRRRRTC